MAILTRQEIDSYLSQPYVAMLTSVRPDGRPHAAPVWFLWQGVSPGEEGEGRALVMTGNSAVKVRNLRRNPAVTLAVANDHRPYQYVGLEGEARLTQDNMAELVHRICAKYDGPEQGAVYAEELLQHGNMVVIDVEVQRIISWKQDEYE